MSRLALLFAALAALVLLAPDLPRPGRTVVDAEGRRLRIVEAGEEPGCWLVLPELGMPVPQQVGRADVRLAP